MEEVSVGEDGEDGEGAVSEGGGDGFQILDLENEILKEKCCKVIWLFKGIITRRYSITKKLSNRLRDSLKSS